MSFGVEFEKEIDKAKIKKALLDKEFAAADVLFKYSPLSDEEYEQIQKEILNTGKEKE